MEIRLETPSTKAQYEQWAMVMKRIENDVFEVDELAHVIQTDEKSAWLLASRGDEAIGCGVGRPSSIAGSLYAMARVLPERRRQGVGSALYAALSQHAAQLGLTSLWGRIVEDDAASRRFAENRGFAEVGREYEVVLDVAEADTKGGPPPGITLVSLTDRQDLTQALYELDTEVGPDVPSHEEHEPMTFERSPTKSGRLSSAG